MGRTIVITGAGAGLGRAVARRLGAGDDRVVLLGRTLSKLEAVAGDIGEAATAVACDVASPDSVRQAFAEIAAKHGAIDVLINNAAVYEPFKIRDATDDQLMEAVMINYVGPMLTCRAALPMMSAGALIINVSSESVHRGFAMLSLYQSSKAGMERFTDALREEVKDEGINVTIVRAGPMYDEETSNDWDPQVAREFAEQCMRRGIDLRATPLSHYRSVAELFHHLINLPADLQAPQILLQGRRPA